VATKRLDFKDRQKAELYAREKAICAYCGTDLWKLRHGANPTIDHDWADHIRPAAKGGDNSLANGMCICSSCNSKKGDNTRDKAYWYQGGKPTGHLIHRFDRLNPVVLSALRANSQVHWTDWYLNRGLCMLSLAIGQAREASRGEQRFVRDTTYWAKAAFKRFQEWRRYRQAEGVSHPRERGLMPDHLEPDHQLFIQASEAASLEEVLVLVEALVPCYVGHWALNKVKYHAITDASIARLVTSLFVSVPATGFLDRLIGHPELKDHALFESLRAMAVSESQNDMTGFSLSMPISDFRLSVIVNDVALLHGIAIEQTVQQLVEDPTPQPT
jgi:hypothetical protein